MIGSCSVISVLISHLQWSHPASSVTFLCQDSPVHWSWRWSTKPNAEVNVAVHLSVFQKRSEWTGTIPVYICKGTMIIADQLIPVLMTDGLKGINDDMMLLFALSCSWHSLHQAISSEMWGYILNLHMIHVYVYYNHVYALQFHHRKSLDIQLGHLAGSLLLAAGHPATPRVAVPQAPMAIAPIAPQAG